MGGPPAKRARTQPPPASRAATGAKGPPRSAPKRSSAAAAKGRSAAASQPAAAAAGAKHPIRKSADWLQLVDRLIPSEAATRRTFHSVINLRPQAPAVARKARDLCSAKPAPAAETALRGCAADWGKAMRAQGMSRVLARAVLLLSSGLSNQPELVDSARELSDAEVEALAAAAWGAVHPGEPDAVALFHRRLAVVSRREAAATGIKPLGAPDSAAAALLLGEPGTAPRGGAEEADCRAIRSAANVIWRSRGKMAVYTGAGVSAESGVPTYRDPNGIWERYDEAVVGHIKGFLKNPLSCWRFEFEFWLLLRKIKPNAGHHALAALEKEGYICGIVTQNVDGMHQKAGSSNVIEIHGNETRGICIAKSCGRTIEYGEVFKGLGWVDADLEVQRSRVPPEDPKVLKKSKPQKPPAKPAGQEGASAAGRGRPETPRAASGRDRSSSSGTSVSSACSGSSSSSSLDLAAAAESFASQEEHAEEHKQAPKCPHCASLLKPDSTYFGEGLDTSLLRRAVRMFSDAKVALVVGSSCKVSPANQLPLRTRERGGWVLEVNPTPSAIARVVHAPLRGNAGELLPRLVAELGELRRKHGEYSGA
eukprot:TRINITY_DN26395_c0_g1_i1.p1 TRINITY_DN26395_c0_g1~~TRINITY_DN26395_c0_g1_i1.p1  ORF type:complete len:594 (+),score=117.77 TRINITY_DN26395_c0_g1_i1:86-1867(+)